VSQNPLFATKSMERLMEEMKGENRLRRVLGPVALTSLGVGAIIGTGIFVLTGVAAHDKAGPALILSFVLAGFACACAGLCYAEFASMIPVAGSAYTYAYATLGEFIAWIIGWDLVLEYAMGSATVANGWSSHFIELLDLFGISVPHAWITPPFFPVAAMGGPGIFNLPAALIAAVVTVVLVIGIRESARFNATMVFIKVTIVLFVIFAGIRYIKPENWHPFMPFGWRGVAAGAATIFFAYIGFDSISTHAEEAKNPKRDVPIGILTSLFVCTILYIAVAAVLTGMVPLDKIAINAPVAEAFRSQGLKAAVFIISTGAVAGITSVLLVMMLSQPRVLMAMARDGMLPPSFFGAVHPRFRTPWKSTILTGIFVATMAGLFPIGELSNMVNIGTLFAFVVVCAAVMIMRRTRPDVPRSFRTPLLPIVGTLGILSNFGLMLSLGWVNWVRLVVWMAIGLCIYFGYSRTRTVLHLARLETAKGGITNPPL
jgi:basic amino acid/polyamine antiporter, APA family